VYYVIYFSFLLFLVCEPSRLHPSRVSTHIDIYIYISQLVSAHPYELEVPCCAERTSVSGRPSSRRIGRGAAYCSRRIMRIRGRYTWVWCSGRRLWSLRGVVPVWFVLSVSKRLVFPGQWLRGWPDEPLTWLATAGRFFLRDVAVFVCWVHTYVRAGKVTGAGHGGVFQHDNAVDRKGGVLRHTGWVCVKSVLRRKLVHLKFHLQPSVTERRLAAVSFLRDWIGLLVSFGNGLVPSENCLSWSSSRWWKADWRGVICLTRRSTAYGATFWNDCRLRV